MTPHPLARLGLAPRLFSAMALVVAAGAGTLLLVALLVAPLIFHSHLHRPEVPAVAPAIQVHLDEAFDEALLLSLALGIAAATMTAALISWLVARRLAAPVAEFAAASGRLGDGHYDTIVSDPLLGPEFTTLSEGVNRLALRLRDSEDTRRRLLTDLTHELRTPLASLEATVEAVSDEILPVDATTLATLTEQTARLHRLVADLESVSRAEERQLLLHPRPIPLSDVAKRAIAVLRPRFETLGVRLTLDPPLTEAIVRADDDRLVEAVMNLLDNALRHTAPGGWVKITLASSPAPGSGWVVLHVSDSGEGFDPEDADRLFERFFRADPNRSRQGSGIGLTITRAIVEAHQGKITAHSDGPGHGALFTIRLPSLGLVLRRDDGV